MINLLPPAQKNSLQYARRNSTLRNWTLASALGVFGIILIIVVGLVFVNYSTKSWQRQVDSNTQKLSEQKLEETQKRVTEISDSVKLTSQVLSRQVLFSKLLTQIGAAMPPGSSLQSLSISSPEGGIDLTAVATNYQTAAQVQINLEDPANKIFEQADIVNVTCADGPASEYPCSVAIRALFAKDNGFQYVGNGTKATP